jgi:hypothetical protein
MNGYSFESSLKFGQLGENVIAQWLRQKLGYTVLPVYEKEGGDFKGPRLFTPTEGLIAPDMWAYRREKGNTKDSMLWVEAKHKSGFDWNYKYQRLVTGIDLRHYCDYLTIADTSPRGMDFWLFFLQRGGRTKNSTTATPAGLYFNSIHTLRKTESHRHSGMVYWAENAFVRIAELEEVITYRIPR